MVKSKGLRGFGVVAGALGLFAAGFSKASNTAKGRGLMRSRGVSVLGLAIVVAFLVLALSPGHSVAASSGNFTVKKLKGTYLCSLNGDDNFENSVIKVSADGKGNLTASKVHVSTDFGSPAPICAFTSATTATVNSDGTGLTTWTWIPGSNPGGCPGSQDDTWAFALGSAGKTFFVASANSGFEEEPAIGSCSRNP